MKTISKPLKRAIPFTLAVALFLPLGCGDRDRDAGIADSAKVKEGSVTQRDPAMETSARPSTRYEPRADESRRISVETIIDELTETLNSGYEAAERDLRLAGFGDVVDEIKMLDGVQLHDIEAEELTREIYRRAEAHTKGQGDRVLARLYQSAADRYPAVAQDPNPDYQRLRAVIADNSPEALDPANFRFSSAAEAAGVRLPATVENAVRELAYVYAQGDLSELSRISSKAFGPNFRLGRYLARSESTRQALLGALADAELSPPPSAEQVARTLMAETNKRPAAAARPQFQQALAELSPEAIGFDGEEDRIHRELATKQDDLPSRVVQAAEAESIDMPGSVEKRTPNVFTEIAERGGLRGAPQAARGAGISLQQSAQNFSDYVSTSFGEAAGGVPSGGGGGVGGGGGGGGGGGMSSAGSGSASSAKGGYRVSRPSPTYTQRSSPGGTGGRPPVSRRYRSAIRSARAARGIAAGAELTPPAGLVATGIAWLANPEDDRFGRIVVQVAPAQGEPYLAASRTLFADSFEVALDVLWGGHFGSTGYRTGEILVMMSMDPFAVAGAEATQGLEAKRASLAARLEQLGEGDNEGQMNLIVEIMQFQREVVSLPRRIVVHPSLHGRELAWSVARIDFSFNDIEGLSGEAAQVNGGREMPQELLGIDVAQASTWQFYERANRIRVEPGGGELGKISIESTGDPGDSSTRSHYSVSMFVFEDDGTDDPEGERIQSLESELQPMLDWLAVNHHDFIRLNDFSEAFSLLRWAHSAGVTPIVFDLDGDVYPIATPDRVVIGDGPKVR